MDETVLIVDDDVSVREGLAELVESLGLPVRVFASAQDFLAHIDEDAVGCLVLDVYMPGMTGLELQQELARRGQSIPTVFITAKRDATMRRHLIEQGAVECLFKPFSDAALQEALDLALRMN